jgi:hypothetical protein
VSALTANSPIAQQSGIHPVPVMRAVLSVATASFLIVLVGFALGVRGPDSTCLILAALAITIGCIPIALDMGRPQAERHIFLSMLAIVYTIGYVMPVFVHYIPAVGPMDPPAMIQTSLLPHDIARGQWVAIVALLSLYVGYALPVRPFIQPILPTRIHEWRLGASLFAICVFISLGWFIFLGSNFGIVPRNLGNGVLGSFAKATSFGPALMMATYIRYRSRTALLLLSIIVPVTMAINFMTGSKSLTIMPAVMCVLTWVILERRIRMRWAVAGFLAIVLLYPVARFWRSDILLENTLTIGHVLGDPLPALSRTSNFLSSGRLSDYLVYGLEATSRRLDAIGVTSVIIRDTPSISPFQNGRTLALIPIAYIPRALWPEKPIITAAVIVMSTTPLALQAGVVMAINAPTFMFIPLGLMHILVRSFGGTRRAVYSPEKSPSETV